MYAGAWRPRIVADDEGLTISNPVRDHRIGWAAVSLIESTELVRVRCQWPLDGDEPHPAGTTEKASEATGRRVIYAWAVHSARRKERIRQLRREVRGSQAGGYTPAPSPTTVAIDADRVAAELSEMAQQARGPAGRAAVAVPPVSRWHWLSIAAIGVPALALLIIALL
jgi:hypothetical protein